MNFIKRLFQKENTFFNVHHPDFQLKVEPAFKIKGIQYYRFRKDTAIPYGRYQFMQTFLLQYDLRMNYELFKGYLDQLEKNITGGQGTINLGKAYEIIVKMRGRSELAFDPAQAYNLASVVYFDDKEVLHTYDMDHNKKKIESWREVGAVDFFYTRPLDELLGLTNFSVSDLTNYIKVSSEIINDLTSDIT